MSKPQERAHMRKKGIIRVFLALFLILAIHAGGMTAEACFCGQSCSHGLQEGSGARTFHRRCSGNQCKSCNVERGQSLKTANTSSHTGDPKFFDTRCPLSALFDLPSANHFFEDFVSFHAYITLPSSPIYLQNRSLLF
jgi:hypothetical protein